jgi:hypothetical protein
MLIVHVQSFGDQKFIPRIPREELEVIMRYEPGLNQRFNMVADAIYSYLPESITLLGYPEAGHVSQYYPASPTIIKEEIAKVHEITGAEFSPENTRLIKSGTMGANGQLKESYNLLVASAEKNHSGNVFELDGKPAVQLKKPTGQPNISWQILMARGIEEEVNAVERRLLTNELTEGWEVAVDRRCVK